ncbi:MAG TPA: response regulator, partial [Spongiibacteraceae bacterium]|nr:response regulator [Spongiibacteraceae bacterium]
MMSKTLAETLEIEQGSPARILLADDDPRLLESLYGLLRLYRYDVDTALGGREALELLQRNPYDLILLDLRMPEISGHDVMQFMTEHHITTMTVVVSGETSIDDISR